jgi:hypothetical protein
MNRSAWHTLIGFSLLVFRSLLLPFQFANKANVNGWLSVYNDDWCNYPSIQVHEIGHNLNLAHAWDDNGEYEDKTGMMGFSYSEADTKMCYNPAKSWQLGWYAFRRTHVDFGNGAGFTGELIGLTDYEHPNSSGKYVNVKVGGSDYSAHLYVGFNLDSGINDGTKEARNQVTVHEKVGVGYAKSELVARLSTGNSYTINNFEGSKTLNINVNSINMLASPPFADVDIYVDGCLPGAACSAECNACCGDNDCDQGDACAVGTCHIDSGTCFYDRSSCPVLSIEWLAANFDGNENLYPLGECQGDCDDDSECEVREIMRQDDLRSVSES